MELGGKSPNIVFEDADLEAAIDGSLYGISIILGSLAKLDPAYTVHEDIYDEFVARFVEKTKKLKLGNPLDKETHIGAVIDQGQLDVIDNYVQSAITDGAKILDGRKASGH